MFWYSSYRVRTQVFEKLLLLFLSMFERSSEDNHDIIKLTSN